MNPATSSAVRTPEPAHFRKYFIIRKALGSPDRESEWSAVTAEPNGCGDKGDGQCQPDPKTRGGKISCWCECDGVDRVRVERKRFGSEPYHPGLEHGGEV